MNNAINMKTMSWTGRILLWPSSSWGYTIQGSVVLPVVWYSLTAKRKGTYQGYRWTGPLIYSEFLGVSKRVILRQEPKEIRCAKNSCFVATVVQFLNIWLGPKYVSYSCVLVPKRKTLGATNVLGLRYLFWANNKFLCSHNVTNRLWTMQ